MTVSKITHIPKASGVYSITNLLDGKRYIGQSQFNKDKLGLYGRCRAHLALLRRGKDSIHLQRAWNKYGQDSFIVEVLLLCSNEDCSTQEEYYIAKHNTCNQDFGYNLDPKARGAGAKSPETIKKIQSDKSKQLRSLAMSNRHWITNGHDNRLRPLLEPIPEGFMLGYTKRNQPTKNPANKGFTTAFNPLTNETIKIHITDPRYLSGEFVHISKKRWIGVETKESKRIACKNIDRAKDSVWVNNGIERKRIPKNSTLPFGWILGKKL
jgi:group I intron endonuclease